MKRTILWLVTARSGSKSIPHKNIKVLGQHPLLSYRIQSAMKVEIDHDLWISTDSSKYSEIAQKYGAQVPFIRPSELSDDTSSSIDVVLHAMNYANSVGKEYDYIGLLEPTSPFIRSQDLFNALNLLKQNELASAIVAVKESRPNRIFIQRKTKYLEELSDNLASLSNIGRQAFEKEITPSGGFYISAWNSFLKHKTFYTSKTLCYEVDEISGLEIDEPIDWHFAEYVLKNKINE